jgi:hypothetical protein
MSDGGAQGFGTKCGFSIDDPGKNTATGATVVHTCKRKFSGAVFKMGLPKKNKTTKKKKKTFAMARGQHSCGSVARDET